MVFGWSPQEAVSSFQEEMAYLFDALVVLNFFCMKFTTFHTTPLADKEEKRKQESTDLSTKRKAALPKDVKLL